MHNRQQHQGEPQDNNGATDLETPSLSSVGESEESSKAKRVMLPMSKFAFLPDKMTLDLGQGGKIDFKVQTKT